MISQLGQQQKSSLNPISSSAPSKKRHRALGPDMKEAAD
jgi:hypothetical protein